MDKLTSAVLGVVNSLTDGAYKVIDCDDFVSALPAKLKTDENGIKNALGYLSERGFIDLRYAERSTYCVCSLPKGRTYGERVLEEKVQRKRALRNQCLFTFSAALFGAFIGAGLAILLFSFL